MRSNLQTGSAISEYVATLAIMAYTHTRLMFIERTWSLDETDWLGLCLFGNVYKAKQDSQIIRTV